MAANAINIDWQTLACRPIETSKLYSSALEARRREPWSARQTYLHSAELLSALCAAAIQWVLRKGKLDLYITIMILFCAAAIQWAPREDKLDLYTTMMILYCATAVQWVLRKGKLDLYITMMILSCASAIQWALREGKLDLYITMMILFSTPQKVPADM